MNQPSAPKPTWCPIPGTAAVCAAFRLLGWVVLAGAAWGACRAWAAEETQPEVARLIRAAGEAEEEATRYRRLEELAARPDLGTRLRADLDRLLPVVDDWANGKSKVVTDHSRAAENGYLCRFLTGKVRPADAGPIHPPALSAGSPLHPIWCIYRGRMLLWQVIQSGPLLRVPERREAYYGEARRLLELARQAFPGNRVVRMYLGEPIPWPRTIAPAPGAPEWANLQREGIEKLADLIHWWIDERQLPDGQFGGGWGDDVEMWRWWVPVLIGFEDPKIAAAQARLSAGMFRQPHMQAGFTARVTDVEHSNEDTTDTILPMMHLEPDDPVWRGRALKLAEFMRERWTGRNERGLLQFKSVYFSADQVDTSGERAFDTVYHPSVIQPSLLLWQRTRHPEVGALVTEWLRLWVDATARAGNGKPAGVLPSAIRWPDGAIGKPGQPWWEPFAPGHNDALYNWPGATRLMTSTLLLAYHLSGDPAFFEPIRSMASLRLRHLAEPADAAAPPGSEAWCAQRFRGFLPDTLAKYRFLAGDPQFDGLLRADASGYVRFRLQGDARALVRALERNAMAFRSNWEAYTSEMRWTDRVTSFTRNYLEYLPNPPPAPTPEILYASATGDPGTPLVFPLNAVRWLTPPRDIAALVTGAGRRGFEAELFHFGTTARGLGAELYLPEPGDYEVALTSKASGRLVSQQELKVTDPRSHVRFELPPGELCALVVRRR